MENHNWQRDFPELNSYLTDPPEPVPVKRRHRSTEVAKRETIADAAAGKPRPNTASFRQWCARDPVFAAAIGEANPAWLLRQRGHANGKGVAEARVAKLAYWKRARAGEPMPDDDEVFRRYMRVDFTFRDSIIEANPAWSLAAGYNRSPVQSGIVGVYWLSANKKWRAIIKAETGHGQQFLGYFDTKEQAGEAYRAEELRRLPKPQSPECEKFIRLLKIASQPETVSRIIEKMSPADALAVADSRHDLTAEIMDALCNRAMDC